MEQEPMDVEVEATHDFENRVEQIRIGLVNASADLFLDLSHNVDDNAIIGSGKIFLDYLRVCIMDSPNIFSRQMDPNSYRSSSEGDLYSESTLRVFLKWMYRVFGAILLNPRLMSLHSTVIDLMQPLLFSLKNNHTSILAESIYTLIGMIGKVHKLMEVPGAALKVYFKYEIPRRNINCRIPVSNIQTKFILKIIKVIMPYLDVMKMYKLLIIQFLEIILVILKQTDVSAKEKFKIILAMNLPFYSSVPQARILWCDIVSQALQICFKNDLVHKHMKMFLSGVVAHEFTAKDYTGFAFLLDIESLLLDFILGPIFRDSSFGGLKLQTMDSYMQLRKLLDRNGLDTYKVPRREHSIDFAIQICENSPLALPVFADVVHKEIFRILEGSKFDEPLNYAELQSRAPIWDAIDNNWVASIYHTEEIVLNPEGDREEQRITFKNLCQRTIGYASLVNAVSCQGDSLLHLHRGPSGGSVQDIMFWDDFFQNFDKLLKLQPLSKELIDNDCKDFLEWLFSVTRNFDSITREQFRSIEELVYQLTFPFFPQAHMEMDREEIEQHQKLYKSEELMEDSLKILGLDIFFTQIEDKTTILKVIQCGMQSNQPSCLKGIMYLISTVKHIMRSLNKDDVINYLKRVVFSDLWTNDESVGILLAQAIARTGCIFTKSMPRCSNGFCEVCDTENNHFYEPKSCKIKQLREFIGVLIQRGSSAVRIEILNSMVNLKRHGLIPDAPLIANYLLTIQRPTQYQILVKLLRNSVHLLNVFYKQENVNESPKLVHMIFVYIRNYLKSFGTELMYNVLFDLVEAMGSISDIKHDIFSAEISKTIVLILTLRWSNCIGTKCRLVLRSVAYAHNLKTSEYMGQIREFVAKDFVNMCLMQVFGEKPFHASEDVKKILSAKCEVVLRGFEYAMEFRRNDFNRVYIPALLSHIIPMARTDKRAYLMLHSMSQFGLVNVKEFLEMYFPFYIPTIAMNNTSMEMSTIIRFLKTLGLSPTIFTSMIIQTLMNEILTYFSVKSERATELLNFVVLWQKGNVSNAPEAPCYNVTEIRNFIRERLMGYYVHFDCKMESLFDNVETKRRIFSCFIDMMLCLGTRGTSGTKMRVAKLLNSCSKKPYLQNLVVLGWKAYTMNLEDRDIPTMMNQILASVLHLQCLPNVGITPVFEEIATYIISDKLVATRNFRHQVYYIESHINNRQTLSFIRNAKLMDTKFLELLIDHLCNGDTHIRYQALLSVRRIVNYVDTSVNLKALLEDSQLIHPEVCRLILALLDCAQSQDKELSNLAMSVFGELGAIDYYRMRMKILIRQSRRNGQDIFPAGIPFALSYIDMLRKQYQGTELSVPSDIDICAYAVQEILRIYKVKPTTTDPIWMELPVDSRSLFMSLVESKFSIKDVLPLDVYPSPIYGSDLGKTFQDWCTNFVIQLYSFVTSSPAKEIIRVTLPLLVRSLPVAIYVLPYVALFASLDGTPEQRTVIYNEIRSICRLWYEKEDSNEITIPLGKSKTPFTEDCVFEEPAAVDARVANRLSVTNSIFSIVDLVSFVHRFGSSEFSIFNNIATTGRSGIFNHVGPPNPIRGDPLTPEKIKDAKSIIPDPLCMARAAFQTQSYQRALLNLEEFLFFFPERTQRYLPFLQRIYIALEDTDSVIGVSVIRRRKPNIYEETLELLATAKKEEAASKFQVMMQKGLGDFLSEDILIQSYLSIEKPEMAMTIMNGLVDRGVEVGSSPLDDCRIEACWKLQQWDDLSSNLKSLRTDLSSRWSLMHAAILSEFQHKRYPRVIDIIGQAREKCLQSLNTSEVNIDSYHRRYAEITRLHILSEVEQAVELMKTNKAPMNVESIVEYRIKVNRFLKNWKGRLGLVQKSLNIIEPIVNTRKALLHIMKENTKLPKNFELFLSAIRDCWITVAKLEIRAKNYTRANYCIQEARQLRSPDVYIQDAKFVALRGDMDRGIRIIRDCMKQYFPKSKITEWENGGVNDLVSEDQEMCSKALLLLAKFNDQKCNVDMDINIQNYLQVTKVVKKSEKNFFQLANYYDTIQDSHKNKADMQLCLVQYYCKSLEYGSKHVYQSLPRLLYIWFDFAAQIPVENSRLVKNYQQNANELKAFNTIVFQMTKYIEDLFRIVPRYIFFTAYSQLISRICHSNVIVWNQLRSMIADIVISHPHQAFWMIMAVSKSTYKMRKLRCAEILATVEYKNPSLKPLIRDYNALADQLILLANSDYNGGKLTTITTIAPSLVKLVTNQNFSQIIIPFQQFLSVTISRVGSHYLTHNPFQQSPIYIRGVENNVEIMPSLQRPKKITLRGSDGRLYGILCKPCDDLRKDSKVMELNHIVNWYLGRNPEARERNLRVRTYAVVPLNEETGLLEWVPNLQGLRPLLSKLYKEHGLTMDIRYLKSIYPTGLKTASVEKKLANFKLLVYRHPAVLREWFRTYFSDPQEWFTARTAYIRTAAVMSMVGYLIGLGDRHGENILLDSISGDVVHVDFNCLFNKGETFEFPETVPFRLTHNMVNAMGPLGYEGPFRRSCEITIEVLRQNAGVFMSVLRPFVFDPLVEWAKVRGVNNPGPTQSTASTTGEVSNEQAVETIRAINLRLEGVSRNMTKELNVALSVEAQVSYLIKEATAITNLSRMYVGWGSYY